jgi:hypothetical protein
MASTTTTPPTSPTATTAPEIAAGLLRPPELPPKHSNTDDEFELLLVERGGAVLELVTGARRKYENKHMALAREVQAQTGLRLPPAVPALQNILVRDRVLTVTAEVASEVAVFHVLLQRANTHRMRDRLIVPQAPLVIDVLSDTSASAVDVERLAARVGAPVRLVWCPLWLLKRLALPPMSPVTGTGRRRRTLGPLLQWYMRHHIAYELLSVPGAMVNRPYAVDDAASVLRQQLLQQPQPATPYELVGERKYSTDWTVVAASAVTLAAARRINAQSAVSPRPAISAPLALAICCSELVDDDGTEGGGGGGGGNNHMRHYRQRLSAPSSWNVLLRQVPGKRNTLMLDLVCARTPLCRNTASDRATKGAVMRTMRECFGLMCKADAHPIPVWTQQQDAAAAEKKGGDDWKLLCMRVGHSSAASLLNKPATQLLTPPHEVVPAGWQWWSMQRLQHLHIMRSKAKSGEGAAAGAAAAAAGQRMFLGRSIDAYFFGPALAEFMRREGWYACCPSVSDASGGGVALAALWRPPTVVANAADDDAYDVISRERGPLEVVGDGDDAEEEEEKDVICAPPTPRLPPLLPLHRPLAVPVTTTTTTSVVAPAVAADARRPIGSQRAPRPEEETKVLSVWAQLVVAAGAFDPAVLQQQWQQQPEKNKENTAAAAAAVSSPRGPPSPERYPRYRHPHYFRHRAENDEDDL